MPSPRVPSSLDRRAFGAGTGRVLMLALVLLLGISAASNPASAQSKRPAGVFFGKLGGGVSDYTGDLPLDTETPLFDLLEFSRGSGAPYIVSGELGYQSSPAVSFAFGLQWGNHPILESTGSPLSESHLLTGHVLGRYTVGARSWTIAPYVDGGVGVTFGGQDGTPGYGPALGAGVDVKLSRTTSFYVESRFNLTVPDDAVDGEDRFDGPFDVVGQLLGAGLKIHFSSPPVPPTIRSIDTPDEVKTGRSVTFTARTNREAATRPLRYEWQFGDGMSESGLTVSHTYDTPGDYTVTFTVRNEAGSARRSFTVHATRPTYAPTVTALDGPAELEVGEPATFRAQVNEEATRPLTYRWRFGDGETGSGLSLTHTYYLAGTYEVTVTARNEAGKASESMRVTVTRGRPLPARIASIHATSTPAEVGEPVRFRGAVQGASPLTYEWDFGDGATATGPSPSHTYDEPGRYTVQLQASNEVGEDTHTTTLRVGRREAPPAPGEWAIVVASVRDPGRAEALANRYRNRFETESLSVRVSTAEVGPDLRHRVLVGQFRTYVAARRALAKYEGRLPPDAWLLPLRDRR